MNFDVFNGDADGIIALIQLRLADNKSSTLITGVKRDIELLKQVEANKGDNVTVLDISMEKNIEPLQALLENGVNIFYADHHRSGDIPRHTNLDAHINLDANCCTSLIVDEVLKGKFRNWAITAAFGDNLFAKANELCELEGLSSQQSEQLKELGTLINYNGYGANVTDLHFHPADLYRALLKYPCPFEVIKDLNSPYYVLKSAYDKDFENAKAIDASVDDNKIAVFELPNTTWAKRISGVYGNYLANEAPSRAHAVLTDNNDGSYTVSLRAPLNNKQGAGDICSQFATGGGRSAAAGVNKLPKGHIKDFIKAVELYYS
ncbi:DHH family phosphoesterase [Shewanella olleyana]|uniref:DHH family phosphoesterase n=1 Tax=Shewanella olleyana TaxID=135626 RepID=UPI002010688C|nr:DHH family phosphoesterase [Shewanella olleyana]MCL1067050.1 DHH family phosphoesterase [Shewanella olleyana]